MRELRVLVAAGSSGGHVFPAISFLEELRASGHHQALLVLPRDVRVSVDGGQEWQIRYLPVVSPKKVVGFGGLRWLIDCLRGVGLSVALIAEFRPDVVIGFGGVNSVPLLLCAWFFRIKTLIHEQNVVPGRANRLLAWFVDRIALSFEATRTHLTPHRRKTVITGNPLRRGLTRVARSEAAAFFGFRSDIFTVLIVGGSQGSRRINEASVEAFSRMEKPIEVQVIHLAGKADHRWLQERYARIPMRVSLHDFFQPMQYAYSAADLAVARSGALTVSELLFFRLPALLIPYPHAYGHQKENARVLSSAGAAQILDDAALSAASLKGHFEHYLRNRGALDGMQKAFGRLPVVSAAPLLVHETMEVLSCA